MAKTTPAKTPATKGKPRARPAAAKAVSTRAREPVVPSASAYARAKIEAAAPARGVAKPKRLLAAVSTLAPTRAAVAAVVVASHSRRAAPVAMQTSAAPRPSTTAAPARSSGPRSDEKSAHHDALRARVTELEAQLLNVQAELANQAEDNAELTRAVEEANRVAAEASAQAAQISAAASAQVLAFESHLAEQSSQLDGLQASSAASSALVLELRAQLLAGEAVRRELHNTLHELRGNIRVICRLRPMPVSSRAAAATSSLPAPCIFRTFDAGRVLELSAAGSGGAKENAGGANHAALSGPGAGRATEPATPTMLGPPAGAKWSFSFDKVLGESASQADVFAEVAPLCQSALDGYRVAIFAYGQTGSGKTHTMLGDAVAASADARTTHPPAAEGRASRKRVSTALATGTGAPHDDAQARAGVIPRAIAMLFACARRAEAAGWTYAFEASLVEVYNEELRDLLAPSAPSSAGGGGGGAMGATASVPPAKLEIRHERSGDVTVPNLSTHVVSSEADVASLLARAAGSRATAKTACNEHSSRSHSVFQLRVSGTHSDSVESVRGCLTLVDLAGSERVKESGVSGARLKEAQAINKSLSALGDVIAALASKESKHIPYRNSKLTSLMQPSLGGNAKTLMVVNVASDPASWNESLCSLRFAQKVSGCAVGPVSRNIAGGASGATK